MESLLVWMCILKKEESRKQRFTIRTLKKVKKIQIKFKEENNKEKSINK